MFQTTNQNPSLFKVGLATSWSPQLSAARCMAPQGQGLSPPVRHAPPSADDHGHQGHVVVDALGTVGGGCTSYHFVHLDVARGSGWIRWTWDENGWNEVSLILGVFRIKSWTWATWSGCPRDPVPHRRWRWNSLVVIDSAFPTVFPWTWTWLGGTPPTLPQKKT